MSESKTGTVRLLSGLAFSLVMGLWLFGCSGDGSDEKRIGAGQTFCSDGLQSCDGSCVSLATDSSHCGSCGNACDAGQSCVDGLCAPAAQTATGGSGSGGFGTGGAAPSGGVGTGGGL